MSFTNPDRTTFEMPEPSRVRGRFPVVTRERRVAPKELVDKLAKVGLAFDRYGRLVICKPDQEMHHASHG